VLRELARKQAFGSSYATPGSIDAAACALHFGMDAERWATMCERTSVHYRRVAGYRYDPTERMEKSRRYAEAAKLIRSGAAPERAGMAGVGVAEPRTPEADGVKIEGTRVPEGGPSVAPSIGNSLDLPVLEQDRCTSAQESHGGHEVIAIGALDHLSGEPGERTVHDAHGGADGNSGLLGDDQSRADHRVDLTKVAGQRILIGHVEDPDDSVAAESDLPILRGASEEHVTREERNNRLDPSSLRRAAFFSRLRKVMGDRRFAQLAGDRLLLTGLRVQAPPGRPVIGGRGWTVCQKVGGKAIGLWRKYRHCVIRRMGCFGPPAPRQSRLGRL
jgi:hypothetical protein